MRHDTDLADQDLEEIAEALFTLAEEGKETLADLRRASRVEPFDEVVERMVRAGLLEVRGDRARLTESGRVLAERQVRRYRLAEMLFTAVLKVPDDRAVDRTACVMEHVLDAPTTDSVCAFLGHPRHCPHGKPIPAGSCCRSLEAPSRPLVQPLSVLPPGQDGRVVHLVPRDHQRLMRLSALGLVPGAQVHLQQKRPAVVVRVGETTLALEPDVAAEIYVKREV
jgi:DtxR family transcriptional regulator, Mn-dependent transcriptional regulator